MINYNLDDYRKIDKSAVKSWIIGRTIFSFIILILCAVLSHFFIVPKLLYSDRAKFIFYLCISIMVIVLIVYSYFLPFLEYQEWKYGIFEDKIEVIHGIFFKSKTLIPISRVQNFEIKQGPIQKRYGVSSIEIITAGITKEIPAVTSMEAEKIAESLKNIIQAGDCC